MRWIKQLLTILGLFSMISAPFAEETVHITTQEWRPYISKQFKHYGVIPHIVTEAFILENIQTKYRFLPWGRGYEFAKEGKLNGTIPYYYSEERAKYFLYSDPIFEGKQVFFHLKSYSFNWERIEDLKGVEIGATIGYHYGKAFERAEQEGIIKVQWIPNDETNFKKMLLGRIDVFPQDEDVGYEILRSLFSPEQAGLFTHHSHPLHTKVMHLILSKQIKESPELLRMFNRGLKRLKESGKYEQYIADSRKGSYRKK